MNWLSKKSTVNWMFFVLIVAFAVRWAWGDIDDDAVSQFLIVLFPLFILKFIEVVEND